MPGKDAAARLAGGLHRIHPAGGRACCPSGASYQHSHPIIDTCKLAARRIIDHFAQHRLLLEQARRTGAMSPSALRRHIGVYVAQLVESHVLTLDQVTAAFIRGEFGAERFEGLRLPPEAPAT